MANRPEIPAMVESAGFPVTLAFTGDGRAFFTERITGNLWEIIGDDFRLVHSFPIVKITGHHETGLLGVALHPDFENTDLLYCFYTYGEDENSLKGKIVALKSGGSGEKIIIDNLPAGRIHNGGIMTFAPDGTLMVGVGVGNEIMEKSQDPAFLGGKVLRLGADGSIPKDNPFPGSPVYSLGHRNIFGLAFHPKTGKLFISEEGPDRDDEINIIEKGGNYGWPNVTGFAKDAKYIDPIITYTPTITPTQCVFSGNDFYFGSYNEGTVHRLTLGGKGFKQVQKDEVVYQGKPFGVIGVFQGPDSRFFVTLPNKIAEFTPEVIENI